MGCLISPSHEYLLHVDCPGSSEKRATLRSAQFSPCPCPYWPHCSPRHFLMNIAFQATFISSQILLLLGRGIWPPLLTQACTCSSLIQPYKSLHFGFRCGLQGKH